MMEAGVQPVQPGALTEAILFFGCWNVSHLVLWLTYNFCPERFYQSWEPWQMGRCLGMPWVMLRGSIVVGQDPLGSEGSRGASGINSLRRGECGECRTSH